MSHSKKRRRAPVRVALVDLRTVRRLEDEMEQLGIVVDRLNEIGIVLGSIQSDLFPAVNLCQALLTESDRVLALLRGERERLSDRARRANATRRNAADRLESDSAGDPRTWSNLEDRDGSVPNRIAAVPDLAGQALAGEVPNGQADDLAPPLAGGPAPIGAGQASRKEVGDV